MRWTKKNTLVIAILVLITILWTLRIILDYPPVEEFKISDVVGEAFLAFLALIWIIIIQKIINEKEVFWMLFIGFAIFFLGTWEDLFDELFEVGNTLFFSNVENLIWIGMILISIGLYRWGKLMDQKQELIKANKVVRKSQAELKEKKKELEKTHSSLVKKNKELEETLDYVYTIRINMQKEIDTGNFKEENRKLKERIDSLKDIKI